MGAPRNLHTKNFNPITAAASLLSRTPTAKAKPRPSKPAPAVENVANWQQPAPEAAPPTHQPNTLIAADPELSRLAVALKLGASFRLWLVILQMVREQGGTPRVTRAALTERLVSLNISATRQSVWRWLSAGKGVFWNVSPNGDKIFFIGYRRVAEALTRAAIEQGLPDLVATNRPGARAMLIDVSGSLQPFEAQCYAAWLAYRENPTIARATLCALWNRQPRILREWETIAGITVQENTAQYGEDVTQAVPEHGYAYTAQVSAGGQTVTQWRAQMVNTYQAPAIRQHPKRGQSRKVSRRVRGFLESLDSVESAGNYGQGTVSAVSGGLNPTGRQYFTDHKHARTSYKRTYAEKPRYASLRAGLWDYAPDGNQRTTASDRAPLEIQQAHLGYRPTLAKDVLYAA